MKEFMEEYGGITTVCIVGLVLLSTLLGMFGTDGEITHLIQTFLNGIGTAGI
ncbi:hypothetical protein [Clostridium sp. C105KSO13]|uniref:hypothetical protein n=1 Tax=Clostridium sp. C105KSO13 TaxID=1776045 RepID=UPI00074088BD|nr:hypothetical protein [Clostridium sp. C105KSO13]CUX20700.1 hypothetical protein BN3456_00434 [Clostridium sp. C105KSO13]